MGNTLQRLLNVDQKLAKLDVAQHAQQPQQAEEAHAPRYGLHAAVALLVGAVSVEELKGRVPRHGGNHVDPQPPQCVLLGDRAARDEKCVGEHFLGRRVEVDENVLSGRDSSVRPSVKPPS